MTALPNTGRWALALHGGAGDISDTGSIDRRMAAFAQIELVGRKMLCEGATAIDTVEHVVVLLEDCVYFNAGKGSVFTHTGTHEMDACIMDGTTMITGACCNVHNIRNPVKLARVVAEETQHCLLCGLGAEALAAKHNILSEDNAYFYTEERYQQLLAARKSGEVVLDHGGSIRRHEPSYAASTPELAVLRRTAGSNGSPSAQTNQRDLKLQAADKASRAAHTEGVAQKLGFVTEEKFSTVGCVACDLYGNLAAAGSTGGLCNKQAGRV